MTVPDGYSPNSTITVNVPQNANLDDQFSVYLSNILGTMTTGHLFEYSPEPPYDGFTKNRVYCDCLVENFYDLNVTQNGSDLIPFLDLVGNDHVVYKNIRLNVNVPGGSSVGNLQNKTVSITQNGTETVTADVGYDGLGEVSVVTNVQPSLGHKSVNINQSQYSTTVEPYAFDYGLEYVSVNVNVPLEENYTQSITSNGTHNLILSNGYEGIKSGSISVNVPTTAVLETRTYSTSSNGTTTITPTSGYDGISSLTLNINVDKRVPIRYVGLANNLANTSYIDMTLDMWNLNSSGSPISVTVPASQTLVVLQISGTSSPPNGVYQFYIVGASTTESRTITVNNSRYYKIINYEIGSYIYFYDNVGDMIEDHKTENYTSGYINLNRVYFQLPNILH